MKNKKNAKRPEKYRKAGLKAKLSSPKTSKIPKTEALAPAIDIYRFMFCYSYDGLFNNHTSTRQRGLYLEVRGSDSKQAHINAEFSKYGRLESLYPESAINLRKVIYKWADTQANGRNGHPIEIHCNRELEKEHDKFTEVKRFQKLTAEQRELVETAINANRTWDEPEIKLVN